VAAVGTLDNVTGFAARWHGGQWGLVSLAEAITARIQYSVAPPHELGVAYTICGDRWIGLNTWLQEYPALERVVIAHEASHHLIGLTGTDWDFCRTDGQFPNGESIAWYGAATLAVPHARLVQWSERPVSEEELAAEYEIPTALLGLVSWVHGEARAASLVQAYSIPLVTQRVN
jgi:hypothetical protein